jgi:hypothetical protein
MFRHLPPNPALAQQRRKRIKERGETAEKKI